MNQNRSTFSQLFSAFQILLIILLLCLYVRNNVIGVLANYHGNDFPHNYLAGYLLRNGGNPYDREQIMTAAAQLGIPHLNPYVYPLFVGELFIPLSYLSYPTAKLAWLFFNHLFLFVSIFVYLSTIPKLLRQMTGILFLGMCVYFFPLYRTFTAGQLNLLILLLLVLLWKYYSQKKDTLAGIILGIATLIKIFPGFFLLYFLIQKRNRIVVSMISTIVLISILSIGIFGWAVFVDYSHLLKAMSYGRSVWSDILVPFHLEPSNQSIHTLLLRIFPTYSRTLSYILSASLLLFTCYIAKQNSEHYGHIGFCLVFLSYLFIPSLLWDHYLVYILFIYIMIFIYHAQSKTYTVEKILFLSLIFIWMAVPFDFWQPSYQKGWNILWMSFKLYPLILLWLYLVIVFQSNKKIANRGIPFP